MAAVPLPEPGDPPLSLGNGRSRCGSKSELSCRTAGTRLWPCPRYPRCGAVCFNSLLRARGIWIFLAKALRALTSATWSSSAFQMCGPLIPVLLSNRALKWKGERKGSGFKPQQESEVEQARPREQPESD